MWRHSPVKRGCGRLLRSVVGFAAMAAVWLAWRGTGNTKLSKGVYIEFARQTDRSCEWNGNRFEKYFFATVPRSGSSLTRVMFESCSGLATETVFENEGCPTLCCRPANVWHNRSQAYGCTCEDTSCGVHRPVLQEASLVKTHFPFSGNSAGDGTGRVVDISGQQCLSGVLLTVRHPLDNYIAWATFHSAQIGFEAFRAQHSLLDFFKHWTQHHAYWHTYAKLNGINLMQFRFEDLIANPYLVIQRIQTFMNLTVLCSPADEVFTSIHGDAKMRNLQEPLAYALFSHQELSTAMISVDAMLKFYGYDDHAYTSKVDEMHSFMQKHSQLGV